MTDLELLEAAADACCYKHHWSMDGLMIDAQCGPWSPLTDDGDALRLAVKLRMRVGVCQVDWCMGEQAEAFVSGIDDELAATRRAIVIAAARVRWRPNERDMPVLPGWAPA